jgi:hypothetical protein
MRDLGDSTTELAIKQIPYVIQTKGIETRPTRRKEKKA